MRTFKLFVSSPGDVMVERRRVENVVSRLNGDFAGVARLQTIRWEREFYQAYSTFQAQIPPSTDCDLVIGIFKWQLGTALPPDFGPTQPDGRPFPSGTAYELLTAIEKRQKGSPLPDVFVFRFAGSSPVLAVEDPNRARIERSWQALKSFFQEWFLSEQGHFKAAFNPYGSEDEFEAQLEKLLRSWLADKISGAQVVRWPIAVKGSPFCGLDAFGTKHAPVFFGRSHDIARAVDLWREAWGRGSPYLLVVGTSGSGKSSLVRAGLLPRLTTPGVIQEVDVWRVGVMRPGDGTAGPFAALAAALMQDEASLPKDEEGRGAALPEIALGDLSTPAELASVLRHADATAAVKPIIKALGRVGAGEREREGYGREVRCDLVVLIDQMDELFAVSVSEEERAGFVALLAALAGTGRVWIAATLRADFYPRMLVQPALKQLKELGATYDLAPPGPVELAEIVRGPAAAAALVFETDSASGESLDTRILREADRPDMLPLVQLALSRLFDARESLEGETRLALKAYRDLGGLKGIVDEAGEKALSSLEAAQIARLPRLLRQLAVPAQDHDGAGASVLTIRSAPLAQAAPDPATRHLVDALIAARLLTTSGNETDAQIRLAHQRVLEDWRRAREIVAENADFYRIRAELEESRRKWEVGQKRHELLLAKGLPLAEAENIVVKYGDEIAPETRAFVKASRARANRAQMIGWAAAAVFALLAVGAGIAAKIAVDQRMAADAATQRADRNFAAAKQTVDGLIFNIAQGLRDVAGIRVDTIRKILDTVRATIGQLAEIEPNDPQLQRSRAVMFGNFVDTYLAAGDLRDAATAADQSLAISRKLAARDPGNRQAQRDLSLSLRRLGDVKLRGGDQPDALAAFQESLSIRRKLAAEDPGDPDMQRDVSLSVGRLGDAKLRGGDQAGALAAYQEALAIARKLAAGAPENAQVQSELAVNLEKFGDVKLLARDGAGALAAYQEELAIFRKLAGRYPGSALPQRGMATSLNKVGFVKLQGGDWTGALAAYQESLGIRRTLAARDPGDALAWRDVSLSLNDVGDVKLRSGDPAGALAAYQLSLGLARQLAAQDPGDAEAQRDVTVSLQKIGDAKLRGGDRAGALAAYEESLGLARKLAAKDWGDAQAQTDLVICLYKTSTVEASAQAHNELTEALAIAEKLRTDQRLTPAQQNWPDLLRTALSKLP